MAAGRMGPGSAEFIHTVTECAKLAFADREAWYGDPDYFNVPLEHLLSKDYNDERRKLISEIASAGPASRPARWQGNGAAGIRQRSVPYL